MARRKLQTKTTKSRIKYEGATRLLFCWIYNYMKLIREILYEKFSVDADPVHAMGIRKYHI